MSYNVQPIDGATATKQGDGTQKTQIVDPVSGVAAVVDADGHLTANIAGDITVDTINIAEPLSVDDNGGSLTVDGSVSITQGGNTAQVINVDGVKALAVGLPGKLSTNNSTSTLLAKNTTFTGVSDDVTDFAVVIVTVHADQDSATDGLELQWSSDNLHWDTSDTYTVLKNTFKTFTVQPFMPYFRVVYENGNQNQTDFHLVTQYKQVMTKPSSHRVQDDLSGQDDAELVKAVLSAERTGGQSGVYQNLASSAAGALHVAVQNTVPISQDVQADANNSSTDNLAGPSFTFTGTGTSTLGIAGIQVSLKTDVNCTVYVDQSPDNSNWDISDDFHYNQAKGGNSWTVQAVNSYTRVRVVGEGASSYFRLQTALCPTVEALPRALTNDGDLKVGIRALQDQFGFQGQFTPIKDLRVAQPYRLVGTGFTGTTVDSRFWTVASGGAGAAVAQANTKLTLTSGTGANGYATATSVRPARFIFAHPHIWRAAVRIPDTTESDNVRRWGCFNAAGGPPTVPVDGFWFECSPAGTFSVNWRNNSGTIQTVSSGSFNGDVSAWDEYNDNNVHAYEIIHFVMGTWFYADNELIHYVAPTTDNMSSTYSLRSSFSCVNGATGGESADLEVWASVIMRLGRDLTAPAHYFHANGQTAGVQLKIGGGSVHKVIILNGTVNSVITLSDSTTTTTPTMLAHTVNNTNTSLPVTLDLGGIQFFDGLRLTVATANAQILVTYE